MYAVLLSFYSFPRLNAILLNLSRTVLVKQKLKSECCVYTHVCVYMCNVLCPPSYRDPHAHIKISICVIILSGKLNVDLVIFYVISTLFNNYYIYLYRESRYLLILTENYAALRLLQGQFCDHDPKIIFGSSFPKDQQYTQVYFYFLFIYRKCMIYKSYIV